MMLLPELRRHMNFVGCVGFTWFEVRNLNVKERAIVDVFSLGRILQIVNSSLQIHQGKLNARVIDFGLSNH